MQIPGADLQILPGKGEKAFLPFVSLIILSPAPT